MDEFQIYRALSDLINDNNVYLSKDNAGQYILGLNDMARYLVELSYDLEAERQGDNEQ